MPRALLLAVVLLSLGSLPAGAEPLVQQAGWGELVLVGLAHQGDVDATPHDLACGEALTDIVLRAGFAPSSPTDRLTLRIHTVHGPLVRLLTAEEPVLRIAYVSPDTCAHLAVEGTSVAFAAPYAVATSLGLLERRLPA